MCFLSFLPIGYSLGLACEMLSVRWFTVTDNFKKKHELEHLPRF